MKKQTDLLSTLSNKTKFKIYSIRNVLLSKMYIEDYGTRVAKQEFFSAAPQKVFLDFLATYSCETKKGHFEDEIASALDTIGDAYVTVREKYIFATVVSDEIVCVRVWLKKSNSLGTPF